MISVEKTANEEAIVDLANLAWPSIKEMPEANDPNDLRNEINDTISDILLQNLGKSRQEFN